MARSIPFSLSVKSIDEAIKQVELYKKSIKEKNELFILALCKMGEINARTLALSMGIWDTGLLYSQIGYSAFLNYGIIYCDVPYGKFVEYGWGLAGEGTAHPLLPASYVYNYNGRNLTGYKSRPFMYETAKSISILALNQALAVFGK